MENNNILNKLNHIASSLGEATLDDLIMFMSEKQNNSLSIDDVVYDNNKWEKFRKWELEKIAAGDIEPSINHKAIFDQYENYLLKKENQSLVEGENFKKLQSLTKEIKDELLNNKEIDVKKFANLANEADGTFMNIMKEHYSELLKAPEIEEEKINIDIKNLSGQELNKISNTDINKILISQLESIDLDVAEDRQKFFKFLAGFKSSSYSFRNQMLLMFQCEARGFAQVTGTFSEWKKNKTYIKPGEKAMTICVPNIYTGYLAVETDESGVKRKTILPNPITPQEKAKYNKKVAEGEYEKIEYTKFRYANCIFAINQTAMKEQDREKYLQRYNAYNTTKENEGVYDRLKVIVGKCGITLKEEDKNIEATGYITHNTNEIYISSEMPVDAKISVLTHELGHYLMKHTEKKYYPEGYELNHPNRELQAQLISHVVLEGVGINSESESSLKYINHYIGENRENGTLNEVKKDRLFCHLQLTSDVSSDLINAITAEELTDEHIKKLNDFQPNYYKFDAITGKSSIVTVEEHRREELKQLNKKMEDVKKAANALEQPKVNVRVNDNVME